MRNHFKNNILRFDKNQLTFISNESMFNEVTNYLSFQKGGSTMLNKLNNTGNNHSIIFFNSKIISGVFHI